MVMSNSSDPKSSNKKIFDSGASTMMFNKLSDFILPLDNSIDTILTASNKPIFSYGKGATIDFGPDVRYVPSLSSGLISTPADDRLGNFSIFGNNRVNVYDKSPLPRGNLIRQGLLINNQYIYIDNQDTSYQFASGAHIQDYKIRFFHAILGHLPIERINKIILKKAVIGLPSQAISISIFPCEACSIGKAKAKPLATNLVRRRRLYIPNTIYVKFQVVAFDIVDIGPISSMQGNNYYVVLLDFCTNFSSIYFIKTRDLLLTEALKPFFNSFVAPMNGQIFQLQCDDEKINQSKPILDFLSDKGTLIRFSGAYKKAQNGRIEKRIDVITTTAATLMIAANSPPFTCESSLLYANDCINTSLNNRNKEKTPYEEMFGNKPNINHKVPFYTPAIFKPSKKEYKKIKPDRNKFIDRGIKCFILRLHPNYKNCYEIYIPSLHKYTTRYDVRPLIDFNIHINDTDVINDNIHLSKKDNNGNSNSNINVINDLNEKEVPTLNHESDYRNDNDPDYIQNNYNEFKNSDFYQTSSDTTSELSNSGGGYHPNNSYNSEKDNSISKPVTRNNYRKTAEYRRNKAQEKTNRDIQKRIPIVNAINNHRNRNNDLINDLGTYWKHFTIEYPYDEESEEKSRKSRRHLKGNKKTRLIEVIDGKKPIQSKKRTTRRERAHLAMLANILLDSNLDLPHTPNSIEEALASPEAEHWQKAIDAEILAINSHGTYEIVKGYKGKVVKSKIAFRVTREFDGSLKYKARLVAKGFTERKGYDYFHTFAPVAQSKSVRMILHIAATEDWEIRNLDVGGAYLEADIDTELYMEIPREFSVTGNNIVRLRKSIYGLKQSGELWNSHINSILQEMNFVRCPEDPCVYFRSNENTGERTILCLYVDDIFVTGNNLSLILEFEALLSTKVNKLKICEECVRFLGNDFIRDRVKRTITIHQTQFIHDLCKNEGITPLSSKTSPALLSRNLYKAEKGGEKPIRSLVGKLRYAVDHSRPDALFAVSQLASSQADPGFEHILAADHLTSYLYGTRHLGLTLGGTDPIILEAFCDSSYVEEADSLSQLAYCMRLGNSSGMFLSRSMRDHHVSLSSSESEVRAVVEAIKDIVWARNMLEFLDYKQIDGTELNEDNQACIQLASIINKYHPKSKHINKLLNFIKEFVKSNVIVLVKIHTSKNIADILTKTLDVKQFLFLRSLLLGN